MMCQSS